VKIWAADPPLSGERAAAALRAGLSVDAGARAAWETVVVVVR
jgi:hypothetical protein